MSRMSVIAAWAEKSRVLLAVLITGILTLTACTGGICFDDGEKKQCLLIDKEETVK